MSSDRSPSPDPDLLGRVLRAPALADGVRLAGDAALAPRGLELRTLFLRHGGDLREHPAFCREGRAECLPLADTSHPYVRAWVSADADHPPDPEDAGAGTDRPRRVLLLLRDAEDVPFALIVAVALPGTAEEAVDEARAALEAVAPALHARAEAEQARARVEAVDRRMDLYLAICDALADPVLVTDRRNRILLENRRARALFHAAPDDSEERRRRAEINNYLFTAFLARPRPSDTDARELTLVDPESGAELLFEAVPAPLEAGAGLPEDAVVSLLRDVTELRRTSHQLGHQVRRGQQAEARARGERDQLNLILAHVGAPVVVTDHRGAVVLMNREAQRLFRPETAAGAEADPLAAANAERFFAAVEEFAAGDEAAAVSRIDLREPGSGQELPAELISGRIRDGDGATAAIVSILHDLTHEVENARLAAELAAVNAGLERSIRDATAELQEQNRQLDWQRQELERAYRHKSEFLASMSHELRTPINALLGYTALLRERIYGELTARQDEALGRMHASSEHLLELVNDILDLAKIEAGRMPLHREAVDLPALLDEMRAAIEPLARRKGLRLAFDVDAGVPELLTDRTRLKQVILNLLSNAVKFTREGGVSVRTRPSGGGVEVEVADTGIGIAAESLPGIFEDFRQVDQSSTREFGGTGLGLSIVRKLLGLMGGSVRVESSPGVGTTFTVFLPLRSPEVAEGEEAVRRALQGEAVVVQDGVARALPPPDA